MSKYNRTYHLFFSENLQNDDRMAEDVESLLNTDIVITEKLDGSNTCLTKLHVFGRSHAAPTNNPWDAKVRELHSTLKHSISDGLYLFGEGMEAIHSIEYNKLTSCFYLFGVKYNNMWLSWSEVEDYAFLLDIPTVPILFKGVFNNIDDLKNKILELSKNDSELGGEKEGIVIRVQREFQNDEFNKVIQKFVRKNHVQTSEHWTRNWRKAKINYV